MAANLIGSLLGFIRGAVIAHVFGAGAESDAFFAASIVPQMFYDLTVGAAISAALIPTFAETWERHGPAQLQQTVGSVLAFAWLGLAVVIAVLIAFAQPVMSVLLVAYPRQRGPGVLTHAVPIVRILTLSLFFLGTSAVLLSTLYSIRRFTVSSFAPSLYHSGVIAVAVLAARPLGILALPIGAVFGAASQCLIQVPALLRHVGTLHPRLKFTPEMRQIVRLYAPVAAGLVVSIAGQIIDLILKGAQGPGTIVQMQLATTLVQFPIGIAAAALGFAVLPVLSADAAFERIDDFKRTLAFGMKLVLLLTIPAAVAYLCLSSPIVALLFERGRFRSHDSVQTGTALVGYAVQIPFVGIDQLLIFAFYARKNTRTPMLVGVVGVVTYLIGALLLAPHLHILGLAVANTMQNSGHALILLGILIASIGPLRHTGLLSSIARLLAAGCAMAVVVVLSLRIVHASLHRVGSSTRLMDVLAPLLLGGIAYLGVGAASRNEELALLWSFVRRARR